jgi:predicted MFS family arabinose efflux permease
VTSDDFSRVCISLSCFLSELGCGAVTATLGMNIPYLSAEYGVPCADLGIVLTLSGLGYFTGVNIASKLLDVHSSWHLNIPLFWLVCIAAWVGGLPCYALLVVNNLWVVKALVFLQVQMVHLIY